MAKKIYKGTTCKRSGLWGTMTHGGSSWAARALGGPLGGQTSGGSAPRPAAATQPALPLSSGPQPGIAAAPQAAGMDAWPWQSHPHESGACRAGLWRTPLRDASARTCPPHSLCRSSCPAAGWCSGNRVSKMSPLKYCTLLRQHWVVTTGRRPSTRPRSSSVLNCPQLYPPELICRSL